MSEITCELGIGVQPNWLATEPARRIVDPCLEGLDHASRARSRKQRRYNRLQETEGQLKFMLRQLSAMTEELRNRDLASRRDTESFLSQFPEDAKVASNDEMLLTYISRP